MLATLQICSDCRDPLASSTCQDHASQSILSMQAALPADELLKLDVRAFAGGFTPTPQRQPARDGAQWLSLN